MRSHAAKYAACVVLACAAAVVVALPVFGQTTPVTLVGAGDIADCSYANDEGTAQLLGSTLRSLTPDGSLPPLAQARAIAMGDNAYPRANRNQYANCYDNYNLDSSFSTFNPSRPDWWGNDDYIKLTMPVLGNHEYMNSDDPTIKSKPYFDYFSAQNGFKPPATAPVPNDPANDNNHGLTFGEGYYSYDLGSWHILALNSNCDKVGGCDASSPQGQWLQMDLANHPAQCTLAYFHHPLYATANGTNTLNVKPLWDMLYAKGTDVILSGHAHRYERHARMTPEGLVDSTNGIRQFVVGTGGEPGGSEIDTNQVPQGVLQKVIIDKFGVIKLGLNSPDNTYPNGSYSWAFIAVDGTANGTVMDSGTDQCHGVPGSQGTTPPTVTNVVPGNGGSDVPIGSKVEATFSKAMDAASVTAPGNFTLTKPDGPDPDTNPDPVSGTVTYDSTTNTATLTPSANLDYSTTYTATVKGGANGVKDTAGNPLSADEVWTFTTQAAALSAPSNLSATRSGSPTNQRIDLSWTDNSSSEAGFVIERSKDNNFTTVDQTYTPSANSTSYHDSTNLLGKTTYYYRVFAVDSTGTRSAQSNVASATTK
jgi:Bacterial Ig-like domain/Calcineurin-like phosphoesterase/Fibronectin type III domain